LQHIPWGIVRRKLALNFHGLNSGSGSK